MGLRRCKITHMKRDKLTETIIERLQALVDAKAAQGISVYDICIQAKLNRKWFDDLKNGHVKSPTVGKVYAFIQALGATVEEVFTDRSPALNSNKLQEFIEEALKYQGSLSSSEIARVVARAYLRQAETMSAGELKRHLDLIESVDAHEAQN